MTVTLHASFRASLRRRLRYSPATWYCTRSPRLHTCAGVQPSPQSDAQRAPICAGGAEAKPRLEHGLARQAAAAELAPGDALRRLAHLTRGAICAIRRGYALRLLTHSNAASRQDAARATSPASSPRAPALHGPGDAQPSSPRGGGGASPPTSPRVGYVVREPEPLVFCHHLQRLVPASVAAKMPAVAPPR